MKIRVILEPSDEGGYTIYVPSLPGCISEGENIDEANYSQTSQLSISNLDTKV